MTAKQFFDLVAEMRLVQKAYFKTRNQGYLDRSKHLEKQIDAEIDRVLRITKEPQLNFG